MSRRFATGIRSELHVFRKTGASRYAGPGRD
jgi:hypothetical protein